MLYNMISFTWGSNLQIELQRLCAKLAHKFKSLDSSGRTEASNIIDYHFRFISSSKANNFGAKVRESLQPKDTKTQIRIEAIVFKILRSAGTLQGERERATKSVLSSKKP